MILSLACRRSAEGRHGRGSNGPAPGLSDEQPKLGASSHGRSGPAPTRRAACELPRPDGRWHRPGDRGALFRPGHLHSLCPRHPPELCAYPAGKLAPAPEAASDRRGARLPSRWPSSSSVASASSSAARSSSSPATFRPTRPPSPRRSVPCSKPPPAAALLKRSPPPSRISARKSPARTSRRRNPAPRSAALRRSPSPSGWSLPGPVRWR